jgi:hypothetical protein
LAAQQSISDTTPQAAEEPSTQQPVVPSGETEKGPEKKKKTRIGGPRNLSRLVSLKRAIEKGAKRGQSMEESAVEFTNGNEQEARNLLRALRYHRQKGHQGLT